MAKECPAEKVGGPHCRGYGNLNLDYHIKSNVRPRKKKGKLVNKKMKIADLPWCSRYEICFVSTATVLGYIRCVAVGPTSGQYYRIEPDDCDRDQYRESFKNG